MGFVFSFEYWSHYCISKVFCEHFRPSEDVIRVLLSCFLNCLFFFQYNEHNCSGVSLCNFLFSTNLFLKKMEEICVWGCEKDWLPMITCSCFFTLGAICTGDPAVQRSAVFLRTLKFYFTYFLDRNLFCWLKNGRSSLCSNLWELNWSRTEELHEFAKEERVWDLFFFLFFKRGDIRCCWDFQQLWRPHKEE